MFFASSFDPPTRCRISRRGLSRKCRVLESEMYLRGGTDTRRYYLGTRGCGSEACRQPYCYFSHIEIPYRVFASRHQLIQTSPQCMQLHLRRLSGVVQLFNKSGSRYTRRQALRYRNHALTVGEDDRKGEARASHTEWQCFNPPSLAIHTAAGEAKRQPVLIPQRASIASTCAENNEPRSTLNLDRKTRQYVAAMRTRTLRGGA